MIGIDSHKRHERGTTGDSQFKGTKGTDSTDSHKGQLDVLLFFESVSRSWTLALVTLARAAE